MLCCLVVIGCASPGVPSSRHEAVTIPGGVIPVLSQTSRIMVGTPDMAVMIDIRPDGSVGAQFGSTGGDALRLPNETIDFKKLYSSIAQYAQVQQDKEHPIPVFFHFEGATSIKAVYMNPKSLPQIMLKLEEQEWESLLGGPVPERLIQIRKKHPIKLITEQGAEGDAVNRAP